MCNATFSLYPNYEVTIHTCSLLVDLYQYEESTAAYTSRWPSRPGLEASGSGLDRCLDVIVVRSLFGVRSIVVSQNFVYHKKVCCCHFVCFIKQWKSASRLVSTSSAWLTLCDFCLSSGVETTKDVKSRSVSARPTTVFRWFYQRDSCRTDSKIESVQLLLNQSQRSFDQRR